MKHCVNWQWVLEKDGYWWDITAFVIGNIIIQEITAVIIINLYLFDGQAKEGWNEFQHIASKFVSTDQNNRQNERQKQTNMDGNGIDI